MKKVKKKKNKPDKRDVIEDYLILHSPTIEKKIDEGLKDLKQERVIPIDDLFMARKVRRAMAEQKKGLLKKVQQKNYIKM